MSLSVFEIIGPAMIGPSSSHTAGACRIGYAAAQLLDAPLKQAGIHLHGSFLATGDGHATREALVAGILGLKPDDETLVDSLALAARQGVAVAFGKIDLGPQAHPNSAHIVLESLDRRLTLTASSIGGGSVRIEKIDGLSFDLSGTLETLLIWHQDTPGFLARITAVLACVQVNVATIRTSRAERGESAVTAIEVDGSIPAEVTALLRTARSIIRSKVLPPLPGY